MSMTISIQLTTRCNLNCCQCFVDPSGSDLPLEHLEKVITFAKEFDCSHLAFTGGEPTLHPELPEVMELLKRINYSKTVSFEVFSGRKDMEDSFRIIKAIEEELWPG